MNKAQRIGMILSGLLQLFGGLLLLTAPEEGIDLILLILGLMFAVSGVKDFFRYLTMTRHMVGGRLILYRSVIALDFGFFTCSVSTAPKLYVALYLVTLYVFSGVIDVLRSRDSKRLLAGHWKLRMTEGVLKILLGLFCLLFMRWANLLMYLFGVSLLFSSVPRIVSAFRRTSVIYIQQA